MTVSLVIARKLWKHQTERTKWRRHSSRKQFEGGGLGQEEDWVKSLEARKFGLGSQHRPMA